MKKIERIRHSLAHVLAMAVRELRPNLKLGIGPVIENGFYYDFDLTPALSESDLPKIEKKMRQLISRNLAFKKSELLPAQARAKLGKMQSYKLELVDDKISAGEKKLSFVSTGDDFFDLCRGGHVKNTSELAKISFKLTQIARAYWKGEEKNQQLTRIYGVAFAEQKKLNDYLQKLRQARENNHKVLGSRLKLFFHDPTAPGMPYLLPRGAYALRRLAEFSRKIQEKFHYQEVRTPILNKKELYLKSGHWEHYREHMFSTQPTTEGEQYALKAMNCPNAMVVFPRLVSSWRSLPLRLADYDPIHRNEKSGTLNGLLRAREFVQDDAHIFTSDEGVEREYKHLFELVKKFYSAFGLNYSFRLGTRPQKFMGDPATWENSEKILKGILKKSGKKFRIQVGDGAFYGPKIDIIAEDSLGRKWQMGTLQLDFLQPHNFQLKYTNKNGVQKTPVVIHRAIYGSLERFLAILIEHFKGNLPLALVWKKAIILPISDEEISFAQKVRARLEKSFPNQIALNKSGKPIGKKISEALRNRCPYLVVVGKREAQSGKISVRKLGSNVSNYISVKKFERELLEEQKLKV